MENWLIAGLLGLGVAMATGFRAFMPMLLVALANKFQLAGLSFSEDFAWLSSNTVLIALSVAAVIEFIADKIPIVDNFLDKAGLVVRPIMGTIAGMAVFSSADPAIPALIAIVTLPGAEAVQVVKGSTRAVSTATSLGAMNPFISLFEDLAAAAAVVLSLLLPVLVPIFLAVFFYMAWRIYKFVRRRFSRSPQACVKGPRVFVPRNLEQCDTEPLGPS